MTVMQKILYFCPVDWRWIKQRPQFLAEELSQFFDIHVIYPHRNNRHGLQKKTPAKVKLTPCYTLPTLGGKLSFIKKLNTVLSKAQMAIAFKRIKPDILWISMPWQVDFFPEELPCRIIYDCMDDYAAISMDKSSLKSLMAQEQKLIQKANVIFASSENLRSVLAQRYSVDLQSIHLLRNGYNANWSYNTPNGKVCQQEKADAVKIGYFGTIGRWFDFQLLLSSLDVYSQIEYHLFGPLEAGVQIPEHERIIYHGVLEHDMIKSRADELDALMMPFVVNDIVESVDPVKLYEYIWMEKNILCVRYPEIERFEPFVMFYRTRAEWISQLDKVVRKEKIRYSHEQAISFLSDNNWKKRAEHVDSIINHRESRGKKQ